MSIESLKADISRLRNRSYNSATNPARISQADVDRLHDRVAAALDDLAADAWDDGYSKGRLDGYFGTRDEKNPYRAGVS